MIRVRFEMEPVDSATLNALAAESSTGTWTDVDVPSEARSRLEALKAKARHEGNEVLVDYPDGLFEPGNLPQLLADISGNIFGMRMVKKLRLLDAELPEDYVRSYPGPIVGMEGIRRLVGTSGTRRPHLGTIVKPKMGLNPEETAQRAYLAWRGGIDFVKDDENLSSQEFCKFEERVVKVLEARDKAEEETGEKKLYSPNVSAPYGEMLRRADFVREQGGRIMMVDVITCGFSALQTLREQNLLPIHAHRTMHAAFTRGDFGVSMVFLARILRLAGVDQLHVGAIFGKMEAKREESLAAARALTQDFFGLKPVFPVASGGLHPGVVPKVVEAFGRDVVIQAGGGIHGHPWGTEAGARAMRRALEAALRSEPLSSAAADSPELKEALKKWMPSALNP